ncbi:MAG: Rieske 2Fe-2S domain-containing protein [Egibacteraceae bacterium]
MSDEHKDLRIVSQRVPPPSQANDAIVMGASLVAAVGAVIFGLGVEFEWPLPLYGGALAVSLFSLGFAVRRYFADRFPDVVAVEPREIPSTTAADEDLADVRSIGRRPLIGRVLAAAAGVVGIGLASPIPSLGPDVGNQLRTTAWRRGARLVTTDGSPLQPEDVAVGGVSTVWPEGAIGEEIAAVVLVRLNNTEPKQPTNLDWVVNDELVAYSKVCTHAGCPVGLFREREAALFCPCHQSTFDAARGAVPTFGPTARPLPQLPMGVDDEGFLVALGGFQEPVGPAFS